MMSTTVTQYNEKRAAFLAEYRLYLGNYPEVYEAVDRTIELKIDLDNSEGLQAAEDVDIMLRTEADGRWRREKPSPMKSPVAPSLPESLGMARMPTLPPSFDVSALRRNATIQRPDAGAPGELLCHVDCVKPGDSEPFPPIYFQFNSFDSVRSFAIDYRIAAKNLPEPVYGVLNVIVNEAE